MKIVISFRRFKGHFLGGGEELVFREWLIIKKEFCVSGLVCVTVLGLVFGRAYNEKDFSPRAGDVQIHGGA